MVTLLYGANNYEVSQSLRVLLTDFKKKYPGIAPERYLGSELEINQLPDILQGVSLFSEQRIVVIRDAGQNKPLWSAFGGYIDKISPETQVILVESAADKRTKTFKAIQQHGTVHEYNEFGPRNQDDLTQWLIGEGRRQGIEVPQESARLLIERVGYDQWALHHALAKLAAIGDASLATIKEIIEPSLSANAFEIFELALRKKADQVRQELLALKAESDPHQLLGLLAAQSFQLALVSHSRKSPAELAKAIGSHPYPLQKMADLARKLNKADVAKAVAMIAECDTDLKHSVAEPWLLIERALLKIAT